MSEKQILDVLEDRIRKLKPSEKSDFSMIGGTLVSKKKVIEEIRKIRSISAGELITYLKLFDPEKQVTATLPGGKKMNICELYDTDLQLVERRKDF